MELLLKISITLIIIIVGYYQYLFLDKMWRSHIDPKQTIAKIIAKLSPADDLIATRKNNAIYQNNGIVAEVTSDIEKMNGYINFKQLCNTSTFNTKAPFEYKRDQYQVVAIETSIGNKIEQTATGTRINKIAVLENVRCKIVKQ